MSIGKTLALMMQVDELIIRKIDAEFERLVLETFVDVLPEPGVYCKAMFQDKPGLIAIIPVADIDAAGASGESITSDQAIAKYPCCWVQVIYRTSYE